MRGRDHSIYGRKVSIKAKENACKKLWGGTVKAAGDCQQMTGRPLVLPVKTENAKNHTQYLAVVHNDRRHRIVFGLETDMSVFLIKGFYSG